MSAVSQNFIVDQGEDALLTFTHTDAAGAVVDITGYTIAWEMRTHELASSSVLSGSGSLLVPASGTFTVAIADTDTTSLEPRVYWYQVKVTSGGGAAAVSAKGNITLSPAH